MKSAVALAVSIGLTLSAVSTAAQDRVVVTPGPIARAAAREAARLDTAHQVALTPDPGWARVQRLAPATLVTLTVCGSQSGVRYVVLANEDDLTVLNLASAALPPAVKSVLLDVASKQPQFFEAARAGDRFILNGNVRLGPDGVFVADRKVADRGQVIERIARGDVCRITRPGRMRGSVVGAIAGAGGGLLLGGFLAANLAYKQCGGGCGDEKALMALSLVGIPVAGGMLGYGAGGRTTVDVIYRKP